MLLRLVTAQGTRTRRPKAELLSDGAARDAERTALEALIRGRVVVANNAQDGAYEIAHEALLTRWSTLQGWLQRDAADHAVHERVEQAAAQWDRMGRGRDLLWGRRQLAEARALDRAAPGAARGRVPRRRRPARSGARRAIGAGRCRGAGDRRGDRRPGGPRPGAARARGDGRGPGDRRE